MTDTLSTRIEKDHKLHKEFIFADFNEAWAFLEKVRAVANQQDHHPEIRNIYNKVELILSTHDAGDIATQKDYNLAAIIDAI